MGFRHQAEDQRCKDAKPVYLTTTQLKWQYCPQKSTEAKASEFLSPPTFIPFSAQPYHLSLQSPRSGLKACYYKW